MALRDIKQKIQSVEKTAKVTKAMESVSVVKMRRAQQAAIAARPYTHAAFTILKRLSSVSKINLTAMYDFHKKQQGRNCIVLVTSAKGLAGALNANLYKQLAVVLEQYNFDTTNTDFICVGKKGAEHVRRNKFTIIESYDQVDDSDTVDILESVAEQCHDLFHTGEYKEIRIVYTNFLSTTEQTAVDRLILPIKYTELHDFIHEIIPQSGKFSDVNDDDLDTAVDWTKEYLYEPSAEQLIEDMVPHLVYIGLYHALLESRASEHSARMIAMKNASDKADEVASDLTRKYNKARQAAITQEISEIVGGMSTSQ